MLSMDQVGGGAQGTLPVDGPMATGPIGDGGAAFGEALVLVLGARISNETLLCPNLCRIFKN